MAANMLRRSMAGVVGLATAGAAVHHLTSGAFWLLIPVRAALRVLESCCAQFGGSQRRERVRRIGSVIETVRHVVSCGFVSYH